MNLAAVLKLPVIFVCENNLYGEWTRQDRHQTVRDVAERAEAYDMPGVIVDGMDVLAVHQAVGQAIERARRGDGPSLVECKTYRFYDHQGVGDGAADRPAEEMAEWKARDPIPRFRSYLIETETLTEAEAAQHRAAGGHPHRGGRRLRRGRAAAHARRTADRRLRLGGMPCARRST